MVDDSLVVTEKQKYQNQKQSKSTSSSEETTCHVKFPPSFLPNS
jgi:hypothetical protein